MTARRLVALYPDHHSRALQFSRNTHERAVRNGDPAIIWASLLDWARARQQAGLREEALKTLRALRGSLPPGRTHPRSRLAMAKLLRNLGEAGQAVSELNQALEKHPDQEFTPEEAALQRAWTGTLSQLRGLALLELERSEEALDAFTVAAEAFAEQHDQVGEAQALACRSYALHELGRHQEIAPLHEALSARQDRGQPLSASDITASAVLMTEGLLQLPHDPEAALLTLERATIMGHPRQDTTLLSLLLAVQIMIRLEQPVPGDRVNAIEMGLNLRDTPGDPVARHYARRFQEVFEACLDASGNPARYEAILRGLPRLTPRPGTAGNTAEAAADPERQVRLQIVTLGRPDLLVDGSSGDFQDSNLAPVYLMTYLLLDNGWKTAEQISTDVFGKKNGEPARGQETMSRLRTVLSRLDPSLPDRLLSPKRHPSGYRLISTGGIQIELDVHTYLSPAFSRENSDLPNLNRLLGELTPFLVNLQDSPFAARVNAQLQRRASDVALHLDARYRQQGRCREAILALLNGLRLSVDADLVDAFETRHQGLIDAHHPEIERLLTLARTGSRPDETWTAAVAEAVRVATVNVPSRSQTC